MAVTTFPPATAAGGGDITGVAAGDGMTGGGDTGSVTLNVVGGAGITANANDIAADYANPSASIGLSAVNGSNSSALRSDGAPALSQAIAPTWTDKHIYDAGIQHTAKAGMSTDGTHWNDSTQKALQTFVAGIEQTQPGVLYTATGNAAVTETTDETTFIGSGVGTLTLPANFFVAGKTIRIKAWGHYGTLASPGAIDLKFKLGATAVVHMATRTPPASASTWGWDADVIITCRTTGGSGTVRGQGAWRCGADNAGNESIHWDPNSGDSTVDTTGALVVDATWQWATSSASNWITCTNFSLEVLN